MRLAILQQSYGRFGGAERLALSHYVQLRRMGQDVTLYYTGRISSGWKERLADEPVRSIPTGVASSPGRLLPLQVSGSENCLVFWIGLRASLGRGHYGY